MHLLDRWNGRHTNPVPYDMTKQKLCLIQKLALIITVARTDGRTRAYVCPLSALSTTYRSVGRVARGIIAEPAHAGRHHCNRDLVGARVVSTILVWKSLRAVGFHGLNFSPYHIGRSDAN